MSPEEYAEFQRIYEQELVELKNDVSEIKKMLAQLTEKMVESNG